MSETSPFIFKSLTRKEKIVFLRFFIRLFCTRYLIFFYGSFCACCQAYVRGELEGYSEMKNNMQCCYFFPFSRGFNRDMEAFFGRADRGLRHRDGEKTDGVTNVTGVTTSRRVTGDVIPHLVQAGSGKKPIICQSGITRLLLLRFSNRKHCCNH